MNNELIRSRLFTFPAWQHRTLYAPTLPYKLGLPSLRWVSETGEMSRGQVCRTHRLLHPLRQSRGVVVDISTLPRAYFAVRSLRSMVGSVSARHVFYFMCSKLYEP